MAISDPIPATNDIPYIDPFAGIDWNPSPREEVSEVFNVKIKVNNTSLGVGKSVIKYVLTKIMQSQNVDNWNFDFQVLDVERGEE